MGLLERVKSLVKANINDILTRADDPEQALDELIKAMEQDLAEARGSVAAAVRDERKLRDSCERHRRQAEAMTEAAKRAAERGNDNLAREALRRRRAHQQLGQDLEAQWQTETHAVEELRGSLTALEAKIEQARRERNALSAQRRLARARRDLHLAERARRSSRTAGLGRLTEAIDELHAQAEAYAELAREDAETGLDGVMAKLAGPTAPPASEAEIEAELAAIKAGLRGNDSAG